MALPIFRAIMLRVYEDHLVGPVPKFPREIEDGIDDYLEMRALLARERRNGTSHPLPITNLVSRSLSSPASWAKRVSSTVRILAMSDIHGHLDIYRWIPKLADAHSVDVVVLAGDLLHGAGDDLTIEEAQRREAREIIGILRSIPRPVLYIMGNDDMIELGYEDETIQSIHGRAIQVGGYQFVGYQYTLPFMGGIFEKTEDKIETDLREIEPLVNRETVLVTHSPAHGVLDKAASGASVGSQSLLEFIRRTDARVHIHGHIHKCFGRSGRHFNVASGRAFRAMSIDLSTRNEIKHSVITG